MNLTNPERPSLYYTYYTFDPGCISLFVTDTMKEFSLNSHKITRKVQVGSPATSFRLAPRKITVTRKLGYQNKLKIRRQFSPSKNNHSHFFISIFYTTLVNLSNKIFYKTFRLPTSTIRIRIA